MDPKSTSRPTSSERSSSTARSRSSARNRSRSSARKQPSYDAAALVNPPSPLMTSSLHSRHSATSAEESAYLAKARLLRWSRLCLGLLVVAAATAAVGCASHVLQRYNSTETSRELSLPLWPRNVDVRPTLAVLVPAALVLAVSLVYLVFSLVPTPYSRTLMYNVLFTASSVAGLVLCLVAVPFNLSLVNPSPNRQRESLQSWTCKFSEGAAQFTADAHALQIPVYLSSGMPVPAGFKRLCKESEAGTGLMIAVLVLEVVSCAVGVFGVWLEKKMGRARRARYADGEKGEVVVS